MNFKQKTYRSEKMLQFTREQACGICGASPCDPHHVKGKCGSGGGMGIKPHDYRVVPLCHFHHMELHDKGGSTFCARHNYSFEQARMKNLVAYLMKLTNTDDFYEVVLPLLEQKIQELEG